MDGMTRLPQATGPSVLTNGLFSPSSFMSFLFLVRELSNHWRAHDLCR